jgi:hypothetical protein
MLRHFSGRKDGDKDEKTKPQPAMRMLHPSSGRVPSHPPTDNATATNTTATNTTTSSSTTNTTAPKPEDK